MTLGKGLGGGAPLAAVLARESVCCFKAGEQGSTFSGNALMTAIGQAVFDTVSQHECLTKVRQQSDYLCAVLDKMIAL